ncbi:hypothetical protein [Erwinia mallotivora]|uniref:hypothetical protein n=1 Tax=Erwinia mallotivora TaxID=69222 RepID=UPI0021BF7F7F|nr:hypothetical protein [Erwinia mallotivora]
MPVSASQHRASAGAYHNKIYDNSKVSNPRHHNINQNSSEIPDEISRIGRDLYRATNSHQVINRVIHPGTSSQPGIVAPLLLLVSNIRLEDSPLFIASGPDTSRSGSDIKHPSVSPNAASSSFDYSDFSSVLSPVSNALYETGQFLSRHDPLRFPGAEGAVLPVGHESKNNKIYEVQDACFNKALFRELTGREVSDAFDSKNIATEMIFVTRTNENSRIKRADVRLQDVAYHQYIANNCHIRTKTNQGTVVGDNLLVAGEMVRNPIRAAAEKAYEKGTGGHEMPAGMVYFTEGANIVYDIVLGAATMGVYPIVKYSSAKALSTAGQAVNGDKTCLKREFSPEELANLLLNTEVGMTNRRAFHDLPVNVKPGELKNVKTFVPDGLFVHENAANQINSVKYMTVNHLGTEYRIIEKKPGEYWTFHPDAVKPELVEKKVYFDAVNDKIHFNSEMPEGQGMDYNIVEGKKFISLHGENHEITWNWDKKRPEVVLQKTNGETLNVPAYMEPLSKVWHMNVHNNKPVFRPGEEKVINEISVIKNNEHNYFPEKNNNQKYYGTGEIYRAEKPGDASHYTQGKYLEMAGKLVPVREKVTPGHGVHYEIYDIKNPEKKGFSVEWDGGRWIFERATSVHVSHELKKNITPDMYDMTADASKMSAPDSHGLRWDEKGNTFLKINRKFVKIKKLNNNRFELPASFNKHGRITLRFKKIILKQKLLVRD